MSFINELSLTRGAAIIDLVNFSEDDEFRLSIPDLIGLVAAFAETRLYPMMIEEDLCEMLPTSVVDRMIQTLRVFNDPNGDGLWCQGDDVGNFRFTDARLATLYPSVNERHRQQYGDWKPGPKETFFGWMGSR